MKKLIKDVNKLMPEIKLEMIKETINKDGSNEDSLKLIDSSLDKVSKEIITKLNENVFDSGNHVIMIYFTIVFVFIFKSFFMTLSIIR